MPSVYQLVLGERFRELDPALRAYFGELAPGQVGHGTGVYEVAGSRHRWLAPALAWLAWRRVLFPEYGRGIPFEVWNTPVPCSSGAGRAVGPGGACLTARRMFAFPRRTREMLDAMHVADGTLRDRLGRRGGLEVEMLLDVVEGGLVMRSGRQWLRLGPLRFRMPGAVRVRLSETAVVSPAGPRQRVDVRMTAPVLGEVFRYAGEFTYVIEPR